MSDLFGAPRINIDIEAQIREVKRELSQRAHVYPRLVSAGKLTQANADAQIARMQAVLATLARVQCSASGTGTALDADVARAEANFL